MKPKKLVYGVGINDADYITTNHETIGYINGKQIRKLVWYCPYLRAWKSILQRCYSSRFKDICPTYAGCTVSEEWLTFSIFKEWMEKQDFEGKQIDKDILIEGNRVYSAETCVFVSRAVNMFIIDRGAARGEWMIGASWHKRDGKFQANCRNPFTGKKEFLGNFTNEKEAHEAWLKRKLELAHELAAIQTDPRVAKALIDRYSKLQEQN